jgi:hypothetical protein
VLQVNPAVRKDFFMRGHTFSTGAGVTIVWLAKADPQRLLDTAPEERRSIPTIEVDYVFGKIRQTSLQSRCFWQLTPRARCWLHTQRSPKELIFVDKLNIWSSSPSP